MNNEALVEELVANFDHHDPRLSTCSAEVYDTMRDRCPVAHSDRHGGFWILSNYQLVHYALQHHELFTTAQSVTIPAGLGNRRPLLPMEVDPPVHIKYRSLLNPVFAPARIAALEPTIREVCDALIDAFADRGRCDLVAELAAPLPTRIFTEMMGLPLEEADRFLAWKDVLLHGHHDDPDGTKRAATGAEVSAFLTALIDDRRARRRDDIVSVLLDSEVDGERLTTEEVHDVTYLLFLAGLDTVTSAIGLQFLHLAAHPDQRDQLVKDPALIPSAVEELLRYESLVLAGRTVTRDLEIGGAALRAGDRVLVNTVAADRDPAQFPAASEVVLDRSPNRHIAFGVGPHRCVGSHLARLELQVVHEHMHRRIPTYRLADGAEVHRYASSVAGLDTLPIVWD
jgi:cytochrome P450